MTGFEAFSIASSASGRAGGANGLPNSEMSAPAIKVRPSQMRTIALTAPFASAAWTPRMRPSRTACDNAFTGGELIVTSATAPSIEKSTTEFMAAMGCFLFGGRDQRRDDGAPPSLLIGVDRNMIERQAASGQLPSEA